MECHREMVSDITASAGSFAHDTHDTPQVDCIQCHRGVGHGTTD